MVEAWITGLLVGYLAGSIPVGLWIGRWRTGEDIRASGSGRTGATNTYRRLGLKWSVVVLLLDGAKGALPPLLVLLIWDSPTGEVLAGLAAMVGHIFPLYAGFRGGRAAAAGMGVLLVLTPISVGVALLVALPLLAGTRIMSLSVLLGGTGGLVAQGLLASSSSEPDAYIAFAAAGWALVMWAHRDNLQRLARGRERILGRPGAARAAAP